MSLREFEFERYPKGCAIRFQSLGMSSFLKLEYYDEYYSEKIHTQTQ